MTRSEAIELAAKIISVCPLNPDGYPASVAFCDDDGLALMGMDAGRTPAYIPQAMLDQNGTHFVVARRVDGDPCITPGDAYAAGQIDAAIPLVRFEDRPATIECLAYLIVSADGRFVTFDKYADAA